MIGPSRSGTYFTIGSTMCSPPRGLCAASKYEQDARAVLAEKPLLGPVDHISLYLSGPSWRGCSRTITLCCGTCPKPTRSESQSSKSTLAQEDQFTLEFRRAGKHGGSVPCRGCILRAWSQVGAAYPLCGPISRCPCSAHRR